MRSKITRVYKPYWLWEDWINGMWSKSINEEYDLKKAIEFTGNHKLYGSAMIEVYKAWPNTMINSLTNSSINRRAFIGHCAVCYKIGIPEYIVRMAWRELTQDQREAADLEAEKAIRQWEKEYIIKLENTPIHGKRGVIPMGYQMKLQLN